jgi:parallel beta-helix repeat protein
MKAFNKTTIMMMICFFIGHSAFADVKPETINGETFSSDISEDISGPQTGVLASGNIYQVVGDTWVSKYDTLIIEPGVTIKFMDYYSFNIKGLLIASGIETDSIVFTSGQASSNPCDWCEIYFEGSSNDNSIISYARIEYANRGIYCFSSSPTISNNTISFNGNDWDLSGIYCSSSSPTIIHNTINNNSIGIYCVFSSSPSISDNTISNNTWSGIYSKDSSIPTISDNIISNNHSGIYCIDSSPIIKDNTIINNEGYAIDCTSNSSPSISDNTIDNNREAISCNRSSPNIDNNIISNTYGCGVRCDNYSSPTISNNTIFNLGVDGVYCFAHCFPSISNNTISNCYHGIYCSWYSSPTINKNTIINSRHRGIYCSYDCTPFIVNNILYDNYIGIEALAIPSSLEYNLFWENDTLFLGDSVPAAFGEITTVNANDDPCDTYYNLFMDPLFVDTSNFDYHLTEDSPCINAGNPDPVYYDPDGTIADIGAFYFSTTGISDKTMNNNISVYPNPSDGIFNISIEGVNEKVQVKVFDIHGNNHRSFEMNGTRNLTTKQLDLKELAAGIYFISFSGKNFSDVRKIVIQ